MFKDIINRLVNNEKTKSVSSGANYNPPEYNNILNLKELDINAFIDIPNFEKLLEYRLTEYEKIKRLIC